MHKKQLKGGGFVELKKYIGIGFIVFLLLFCGYSSFISKEEIESQIGTTLERRQERLKEATHETAEILSEKPVDEEGSYIVCSFRIYEGQQAGVAWFEKMENGSYQFRSASWAESGIIHYDTFVVNSELSYLVYFLDQPDLEYAEVTFKTEADEWTETYETDGIVLIEMPQLHSFSTKTIYYDIDGNVYH